MLAKYARPNKEQKKKERKQETMVLSDSVLLGCIKVPLPLNILNYCP
jgi:hypothetical protein